ncbi:MAG: hypothetical protein U1G08_17190 [Verrucomicrobiota bacterium]
MAKRYVRTDSLALSWAECWNLPDTAKGRCLLLAMKVLRNQVTLNEGIPLEEDPEADEIPAEAMPAWARNRLKTPVDELTSLGFEGPWFRIPVDSLLPGIYGASVTLHHPRGDCFAVVLAAVGIRKGPPIEEHYTTFLTPLAPGYSLYTTNGTRRYDPVPGNRGSRHPGIPVAELHARHIQSLVDLRTRREIRRVSTSEEVREHLAASVRRFNEWMLSRGVWVLMTDAEVARLREKVSKLPRPLLPPEFPAAS